MTDQQPATPLYPPDRLERAAEAAGAAGFGALLLTPGPDLRYVCGYDAHQLERLTCLAIPAGRPPFLVVPRLEQPAALASPAGGLGLDILAWDETDDPYALVASRLGPVRSVGVADHMWAMMTLRLRAALPGAEQGLASAALRDLRIRKSTAEAQALRAAGDAIVAEGHARTDFTIVASGPNAASPHHSVSDRVILPGDVVVVDIGGTMPSGYCSDCTRTYAIGEPPPGFAEYYQVLKDAQEAACAAVKPGISAEAVDAAAREPITAAGYGEHFVHRTGHGIGLEVHEDPYIVAGNTELLEPGMAFSIEPGIYPGGHGARIEDIVVCGDEGADRLNNADRELVVVAP